MNKHLIEPSEGIILTMPVIFFEETGHTSKTLCKQFEEEFSNENGLWYFLKKNLPVQDFIYIYIVWDGKIQYRTNLASIERNKSYAFCDEPDGKVRRFENKNWIILCNPLIKAPYEIPMKGFQWHRYTKKIF
jgi:hypothetical protein